MTPALRMVSAILPGLIALGCMTPSASGTKTNWFFECDAAAPCGEDLSCICGVCTLPCTTTAACEEGRCSSELASDLQCGADHPERICLPDDAAECVEGPVAADAELGEALAPACDIDGALVCEAFDRPFPTEYSTWYEDDMSAVIQDCDLHQGAGALRYSSNAAGQAQTRIRLPTPVSSGPLHARFFVKLGTDMVLPEQLQLFEFWDREDSAVPDRASLFVGADGVPRVYLGSSGTTVEPSDDAPLPRETWLCFEFALDVQDQDGHVELLLDGVPLLSASGLDSQPADPISVVVVEAQPTTDTTGVDIHFDDLVVATGPIGCP